MVFILSEHKTIANVVKVALCKQTVWNPNPAEVSCLTSIGYIQTWLDICASAWIFRLPKESFEAVCFEFAN